MTTNFVLCVVFVIIIIFFTLTCVVMLLHTEQNALLMVKCVRRRQRGWNVTSNFSWFLRLFLTQQHDEDVSFTNCTKMWENAALQAEKCPFFELNLPSVRADLLVEAVCVQLSVSKAQATDTPLFTGTFIIIRTCVCSQIIKLPFFLLFVNSKWRFFSALNAAKWSYVGFVGVWTD